MIEFIIILVIVFLLIGLAMEIGNGLIYNNFVNKKTKELIMSYDETNLYTNPYSSTILMSYNHELPCIYPVYISLLAKYYVVGHGMVWRFSKLSRKIDSLYSGVKPYNPKKLFN